MAAQTGKRLTIAQMAALLREDRGFVWLAVVYSVALSLLSLAVPLCVQTLVNSVANIAVFRPVIILGIVLFVLLAASGILVGLQVYLMEIFERRFFCRVTADIVMRTIYGRHDYFEGINREELFNRYFEVMNIQKNVPRLLVGGLAIVLNAAVGFVVVSFYHPVFLVFNAVLIFLLYVVIRGWGGGAIRTVGELSDAKYRFAGWLEEMARANNVFKASRYIDAALTRTETMTADYIGRHAEHFRYRFLQIAGLLGIYALASSALLVLGGWLVIQGELTLGQLVAAELILSVIFASLVGFGSYLDAFYEGCAALEKIAYFYRIPLEANGGRDAPPPGPAELRFDGVRVGSRRGTCTLDFGLPAGATVLAVAASGSLEKAVVDLLQRHRAPEGGSIRWSGSDLADCDTHALRDRLAIIDSSGIIEGTVFEYLSLGRPDLSQAEARDMLRVVGLEDTLDGLESGFDTPLRPFGYPLSRSETLRLKLAAALLTRPGLLIITEIFDTVNRTDRARIVDHLARQQATTVLYFSNRRDTDAFTRYLYIGAQDHAAFDSLAGLVAHEERQRDPTVPA
jgi:ABC-type multidrug transport system fused ATPase/permease subunit